MKKNTLKILLILNVLSISAYASGIPVFDGGNFVQNIKSYIDELKEYAERANRWTKELMQYRQVLEHYAQEIKNTTGISDVMSAVNNAEGLYKQLQEFKTNSLNLQAMIKEDLNGKGLIKRGQELSTKFLLSDYCSNYNSTHKQEICYKEIKAVFDDEEQLKQLSDEFDNTLKEIAEISKKAVKATTMKEAVDAQIALQSAQVKLQAQEQVLKTLQETQKRRTQINELLKENLRVEYNKKQYSPENLKIKKQFRLDDVSFK